MNNQELIDNNNQLDNVSNRKGQPGSLGTTTTGPNDHSQPGAAPARVDDSVDASAARTSNDAAGAYPRSPGGANGLAADAKMDDDTGLSNTVNRQQPVDGRAQQAEQSNVGRRDDMTPD